MLWFGCATAEASIGEGRPSCAETEASTGVAIGLAAAISAKLFRVGVDIVGENSEADIGTLEDAARFGCFIPPSAAFTSIGALNGPVPAMDGKDEIGTPMRSNGEALSMSELILAFASSPRDAPASASAGTLPSVLGTAA
jgi:hypothetical protein